MNKTYRVIFLGESQLMYRCARKVRNYYGNQAAIRMIDVSNSATQKKKKLREEFGDTKEFETKEDIFECLRSITEKTVLFSINNPYIIPESVCGNGNLCMINLHHALLPKHPGRNAAAWTIYDGDAYGGITWHFITPGVDAGDIICQRKTAITESTTSLSLLRECETLALESFDVFLPLDNISGMNAIQQTEDYRHQLRKSTDIPNGGFLNLNWDINKCLAFLNAMNYGIIHELGRPMVEYGGHCFEIKYYSITSRKLCGGGTELLINPMKNCWKYRKNQRNWY